MNARAWQPVAAGFAAEISVGCGGGGEESLEARWPGMLDLWTPQVGCQLKMRGPFGRDFLEGKMVPRENKGRTSPGPVCPCPAQGFRGALCSTWSRETSGLSWPECPL